MDTASETGSANAAGSAFACIPDMILEKSAVVMTLSDILKSFDPEKFDAAKTKYRKPSYQRGIDKPIEWNISVVNSIIEGKAIGGVVVSKWNESAPGSKPGKIVNKEFFNIEDGGTRLNACKKFYDGNFACKYGKIDDVRERFEGYKVAVELLERSYSCEDDEEYFAELCNNFSLLQDGTPLTASDKYAAHAKDEKHSFTGSPIVNYTIEMCKSSPFKELFGHELVGPREKNRKNLAAAISIVSGAMWGAEFANSQFGLHIKNINKELTFEDKTKFGVVIGCIARVIKTVEDTCPKWKGEHFGKYFNNTAKFVGSMIADIWSVDDINQDFKTAFVARWSSLIVAWRDKIYKKDMNAAKDWIEQVVYTGLDAADKRNILGVNLVAKSEKVQTWFANQ